VNRGDHERSDARPVDGRHWVCGPEWRPRDQAGGEFVAEGCEDAARDAADHQVQHQEANRARDVGHGQ
jgi:hypothetical protein